MVQNLPPGGVKEVAEDEITGNVHIYRTSQGYDSPGTVGWKPDNGPLQIQSIDVGQHVTFAINGESGMIANGCPSKVQLLWDNSVATTVTGTARVKSAAALLPKVKPLAAKPDSSSPIQQAMDTLNAQWYNALITGCHLDSETFQLVQANMPLGMTSEFLWNIFDAVPPLSVSNFFNPSQANDFSTDYGGVINNLVPQNSNKFQIDMGDYYSQWVAYLKTNPTMPTGGILQLFQNWSAMNMPPNQAQTCYTDWQQIAQGTIPIAVQMWLNAGGGTGGVKAYNATVEQLKIDLQSAPSASAKLNSLTDSSDITNTWAKAQVGGFFDLFEGSGNAEYSSLSIALANAGLSINASFDHLMQFTAAPLAKTSSDPILQQYQPWYNSEALKLAYGHKDNTVWQHGAPTWDDTFGSNGNMLRTCSSLIVVDGINIVTKSNVGFSSDQQQQFQAAVQAGFFPFFEASASGGWSHSATFDAEGNVTVTSSCPAGNPNILGAIVTPIQGVLAI